MRHMQEEPVLHRQPIHEGKRGLEGSLLRLLLYLSGLHGYGVLSPNPARREILAQGNYLSPVQPSGRHARLSHYYVRAGIPLFRGLRALPAFIYRTIFFGSL